MTRSRLPAAARLAGLAAAGVLVAVSSVSATFASAAATSPKPACDLHSQGGRIQHVVSVMFDNVHFTRDDPNVPSDLEQMPNLLNFITGGGTLVSHEHTPLIAHTGTDILTSFTGLYGDGMGAPVANSFGFFDTNAFASFRSTFEYWNTTLGGRNDNTFFMTTPAGRNTPAPWVPFTRAGCNVGEVSAANVVLENANNDIPAVFGAGSPQDNERKTDSARATADFVGIAVHCGKAAASCAGAAGARPDVLPQEPGGYQGFDALFGAANTNPVISPGRPLTDLDGNVIADSHGNPGFPGFDSMSASVSLAYVAAMQEHGVPITNAYISDAHDSHTGGGAFGPGEAGYVAALKSYDDAFGKFFARLRADGITRDNTLFTFTSDENDHFVGGPPSPTGCDGVHVACTYARIGELNANLSGLLSAVPPYSTGTAVPGMSVHSDSAPTVYLDGNPAQDDQALTRTVERGSGHIEAVSPITGETDRVTNFLAGTVAMRNLHMLTSDPARNPTFTLFANPDYFLCATGFQCPETGTQVVEDPGFAWNHGDFAPDINTTWLGVVGPGVRHLGVDDSISSDHANDRPTVLALVGLKDDYAHEGRVLAEVIDRAALPAGIGDAATYARLGQLFNQINAPVGQFGQATLRASTTALESGSAQNDSVFTTTNQRLTRLGAQRDALAKEFTEVLDRPVSTAAGGGDHDAADLQARALDLLQQAWLVSGQ